MPNKGPWIHRFLTIFFTLIFAVLWFWLLGFIVDDIGSWPGPSYAELERQRLDPALVTQADALQRQIADTQRRISEQKARQHCQLANHHEPAAGVPAFEHGEKPDAVG